MRFVLAFLLAVTAQGAAADVFGFSTPSGNIHCSVGVGEGPSDIDCTIYERFDPPAYPRPANCGANWGHRFAMRGIGGVQMFCEPLGPHPGPAFEVAPYGETGNWGDIVCTSQTSGFQCTNSEGHGFFLSRRVQRVW